MNEDDDDDDDVEVVEGGLVVMEVVAFPQSAGGGVPLRPNTTCPCRGTFSCVTS